MKVGHTFLFSLGNYLVICVAFDCLPCVTTNIKLGTQLFSNEKSIPFLFLSHFPKRREKKRSWKWKTNGKCYYSICVIGLSQAILRKWTRLTTNRKTWKIILDFFSVSSFFCVCLQHILNEEINAFRIYVNYICVFYGYILKMSGIRMTHVYCIRTRQLLLCCKF